MTIYIIEENATMRLGMVESLRREDYAVRNCSDNKTYLISLHQGEV